MISLVGLAVLLCGSALALGGCFEESYGLGYGYGAYYPYGPTSYSGPPVIVGDWDEHHEWHNRDWWVDNRRPWVEEHHHEWLARPVPHQVYGHRESNEHD
jgi:hypothetical protein